MNLEELYRGKRFYVIESNGELTLNENIRFATNIDGSFEGCEYPYIEIVNNIPVMAYREGEIVVKTDYTN